MQLLKKNAQRHVRPVLLAGLLGMTLGLSVQPAAAAEPVNINVADAKALAAAIDGVGMKRAQAIIQHRDMHGPFESIEALREVQGIGMKTVNENRSKLTVQ